MDITEELKKIVASNEELKKEQFRDLSPYIITQAELSKEDIPKRKFVLGEWMPEDSFGMVYANRGVGKSWFCMAMAVAIANGDPTFLGWEIHKKTSVLYVDGEMAKVEIKERFDHLSDYHLDNLFILSSEMLYRDGKPICLDNLNDQLAIDNVLEKLEQEKSRPQILILDNLSTLRRGINENDNNEAQQLLDWLISLRHKQYTVIIVHHSGQSGQQRGASIIEVPMDFTIKLSEKERSSVAKKQEARFDLKIEKVRAKRPLNDEFSVSLRPNDQGTLSLYFDVTESNIEPRYRVLKYLKQKGRETYRVMAHDLEMATGSIGGHLNKLLVEELIEGAKASPKVTVHGRSLLHDFWPDEFVKPNELELVQDNDVPF